MTRIVITGRRMNRSETFIVASAQPRAGRLPVLPAFDPVVVLGRRAVRIAERRQQPHACARRALTRDCPSTDDALARRQPA